MKKLLTTGLIVALLCVGLGSSVFAQSANPVDKITEAYLAAIEDVAQAQINLKVAQAELDAAKTAYDEAKAALDVAVEDYVAAADALKPLVTAYNAMEAGPEKDAYKADVLDPAMATVTDAETAVTAAKEAADAAALAFEAAAKKATDAAQTLADAQALLDAITPEYLKIVSNNNDAANKIGDISIVGDGNNVNIDQSININNYYNYIQKVIGAATPKTGDAMSVVSLLGLATTALGGAFVAKKRV